LLLVDFVGGGAEIKSLEEKFMDCKPSKNTTLESFIDLVKNDVQTATSTNIPTHSNLTPAEKGAIQELKERDDIIIKPVDKGSAVVMVHEGRFEDNQWCLSNVRVALIHEVEGGDR
jgi:hypothetical protein